MLKRLKESSSERYKTMLIFMLIINALITSTMSAVLTEVSSNGLKYNVRMIGSIITTLFTNWLEKNILSKYKINLPGSEALDNIERKSLFNIDRYNSANERKPLTCKIEIYKDYFDPDSNSNYDQHYMFTGELTDLANEMVENMFLMISQIPDKQKAVSSVIIN